VYDIYMITFVNVWYFHFSFCIELLFNGPAGQEQVENSME